MIYIADLPRIQKHTVKTNKKETEQTHTRWFGETAKDLLIWEHILQVQSYREVVESSLGVGESGFWQDPVGASLPLQETLVHWTQEKRSARLCDGEAQACARCQIKSLGAYGR